MIVSAGCATPYKQRSGRFGYDDFRITEDVFEVSFAANAKTAPSVVRQYVFRRASEVTLSYGFSNFLPLFEEDRTLVGSFNTASGSSTTHVDGSGNTAWSHGSASGLNIPFQMPAGNMRIQCFKNPLPDVQGLIDARQFLRFNFPDALAEATPNAITNTAAHKNG